MSNEDSQNVTVLYHIENHKDRVVTILGVFSDKNPGTGKIHAAKEAFKARRALSGVKIHDFEFHLSSGTLDNPYTFDSW